MDKRLLWLAVGAFATSTMAFVFAGLLPLVAAATHVTISEAGRLVMAYSLAYAIGTPILATLTGAVDRKRVILGALVLFVAGNIMAATSNSFTVLTAAQIVMGMAAGLFAATAQATAVMLAGLEHRAKAVAAVVGGTTFAVALGAPLGSLIGNLAGWRATFLFVGLLAVLCAIVLALMLPRGLPGVKLTLAERMLTITRPRILPSLVDHLPLSDRRLRRSCAISLRWRSTAPGWRSRCCRECCSPSASGPSPATTPAASLPTGSARPAWWCWRCCSRRSFASG